MKEEWRNDRTGRLKAKVVDTAFFTTTVAICGIYKEEEA